MSRYPTKSLSILCTYLVYLFTVWSLYRFVYQVPEWIDDFLVKPVLWLIPLGIVLVVERSSFSYLGLTKPTVTQCTIGIAVGTLLVIEYYLIPYSLGREITLPSETPFYILLTAFATAITEEIVFRGYIQTRLRYSLGVISALMVSSILFVAIHVPLLLTYNNILDLAAIAYLCMLLLLSMVNGILFSQTKSLVPSIIVHTFWNAAPFWAWLFYTLSMK